ncbi:MAG: DUF3027 domain-containing protein [Actinomycetota bacterium]|nr:DUF3027 domain-containing protein [Actinomycetota bacterium]
MCFVTVATAARTRPSSGPDAVCAQAVEPARAAAVEVAGGKVGDHLGVVADGERLVTHLFAGLDPAYVGWHWAVTVARASRAKNVTVDEVVLLPGTGALLPPPWVPWSDRLRPGDLGVGDLLPTTEDDDRLAPAYAAGDDPQEDEVAWELGVGRVRVLSYVGRIEAAERWYDGDSGPEAPIAKAAPARCGTCGFFLQVAGSLRQVFGVCANEFAPSDGRVVAVDHGCGAHSEAVVVAATPEPTPSLVEDYQYEAAVSAAAPERAGSEHALGSVSEAEPAEPLGHS